MLLEGVAFVVLEGKILKSDLHIHQFYRLTSGILAKRDRKRILSYWQILTPI